MRPVKPVMVGERIKRREDPRLIRGLASYTDDLKLHGIPNTVAKAIQALSPLAPAVLTVHAAGGRAMLEEAKAAAPAHTKVVAVTVLTSLDKGDIAEMGYSEHTVEQLVLFRARKALDAGCDGVIASGAEAAQIKRISEGRLLVVTPGIRRASDAADEQTRRTGPAAAIAAGADYLVVGRPIIAAADPRSEAASIVEEMQGSFDALP